MASKSRRVKQGRSGVVVLRPMSDAENALFVKCLAGLEDRPDLVQLMGLFGEEFFLFISVFAGQRMRVPSLAYMKKLQRYCAVYDYLSRGNFSKDRYVSASRYFLMKASALDRAVAKVKSCLELYRGRAGKWKME